MKVPNQWVEIDISMFCYVVTRVFVINNKNDLNYSKTDEELQAKISGNFYFRILTIRNMVLSAARKLR